MLLIVVVWGVLAVCCPLGGRCFFLWLCDVCCLASVVWYLRFVVCWFGLRCVLFVDPCVLCGIPCILA